MVLGCKSRNNTLENSTSHSYWTNNHLMFFFQDFCFFTQTVNATGYRPDSRVLFVKTNLLLQYILTLHFGMLLYCCTGYAKVQAIRASPIREIGTVLFIRLLTLFGTDHLRLDICVLYN